MFPPRILNRYFRNINIVIRFWRRKMMTKMYIVSHIISSVDLLYFFCDIIVYTYLVACCGQWLGSCSLPCSGITFHDFLMPLNVRECRPIVLSSGTMSLLSVMYCTPRDKYRYVRSCNMTSVVCTLLGPTLFIFSGWLSSILDFCMSFTVITYPRI
jgi:hypothetical protein